MEIQQKVTGYRDLSIEEINAMNLVKSLEAACAVCFKQIQDIDGTDPRLLALGKTNLQQGFMWLVRAVAKPQDPFA